MPILTKQKFPLFIYIYIYAFSRKNQHSFSLLFFTIIIIIKLYVLSTSHAFDSLIYQKTLKKKKQKKNFVQNNLKFIIFCYDYDALYC